VSSENKKGFETMKTFAPETCHEQLLKTVPRQLAFDPQKDFQTWRQAVEAKLRELIGILPEKPPLNLRKEYEGENDLFRETRFVFKAEAYADVPCHLLTPQQGNEPFPVIICLQGHTTGMHISLGRPKYEGDEELIKEGDRDFALQAVREGYAALVVEQRCFGERKDRRPPEIATSKHTCHHAAMTALLLGRTMIGERVWDVSRAIDALSQFPEIDTRRIGCLGNSGGGTITYFTTCLDSRISIAMPSCYVCTFRDSIASIDHCADNYIPGVLRYFEMADLAGLIAPRPLIMVAGRDDPIFPLKGVEEAFDTIQQIYRAAGVPDRCRLIIGEGGHRFYAAQSLPVFRELAGW
jgi:cephalosporin-C deacetylase-like acetyl esterase